MSGALPYGTGPAPLRAESATQSRAEPLVPSAGHTPGPWAFEPHGAFRSVLAGTSDWPLGYISTDFPSPIFALHEVVGDMDAAELVANARLIAAAPELLESAQLLASLCAWLLHRFGHESPEGREAHFRLTSALAAIAKARGDA